MMISRQASEGRGLVWQLSSLNQINRGQTRMALS